MASFNRVILIGNLTRDIELRYLPSQMAVADIGLAVNDRRKNANGEWIEETTFVDVTVWGRTAEVMSEYLSKGSPVFIEGRLKLDSWEQDGQKRSKLKVVCERMQLIGAKGQGGQGAPGGQGGPPRSAGRPAPQRNQASQYNNQAPPPDEAYDPGPEPGEPSGGGDDIPF
jgi:single-strand DNA-binding protein